VGVTAECGRALFIIPWPFINGLLKMFINRGVYKPVYKHAAKIALVSPLQRFFAHNAPNFSTEVIEKTPPPDFTLLYFKFKGAQHVIQFKSG
jgi:hypothetical protein